MNTQRYAVITDICFILVFDVESVEALRVKTFWWTRLKWYVFSCDSPVHGSRYYKGLFYNSGYLIFMHTLWLYGMRSQLGTADNGETPRELCESENVLE
jgi:hypothetical protein